MNYKFSFDYTTSQSLTSIRKRKTGEWFSLMEIKLRNPLLFGRADNTIIEEIQVADFKYLFYQCMILVSLAGLAYKYFRVTPNGLFNSYATLFVTIPVYAYLKEKREELLDIQEILIFKYKDIIKND